MDRLSAVIALCALVGCEDKAPSGDPPSRVNAAKTAQRKDASVEAFCDVYAPADKAKPMTWPELVAPRFDAGKGRHVETAATGKPTGSGWRWVNIWATWCKPCVEEIPRLVKWQHTLGKIELTLVSVDQAASDLDRFEQVHPGALKGVGALLRLAPQASADHDKAQETWFAQLGLQGAPPIPIHVFVDPQDRVRCVRAGGVREQDYAVIEKLLAP